MNRERWRAYNRRKQWEYRVKRRGGLPRPYVKTEDRLSGEGHCGCCGMLVSSEYHQQHPLVGCIKWAEAHQREPSESAD